MEVNRECKYHENNNRIVNSLQGYRGEIWKNLTAFAASYVIAEFNRHQFLTIKQGPNGVAVISTRFEDFYVKPSTCTCMFFRAFNLPCRHVFHLRYKSKLPIFTKE